MSSFNMYVNVHAIMTNLKSKSDKVRAGTCEDLLYAVYYATNDVLVKDIMDSNLIRVLVTIVKNVKENATVRVYATGVIVQIAKSLHVNVAMEIGEIISAVDASQECVHVAMNVLPIPAYSYLYVHILNTFANDKYDANMRIFAGNKLVEIINAKYSVYDVNDYTNLLYGVARVMRGHGTPLTICLMATCIIAILVIDNKDLATIAKCNGVHFTLRDMLKVTDEPIVHKTLNVIAA
jgi:hypothetical protein